MLKSILQPYNNFKFIRESLSQDNSEQAKTIFSQEMYSKAASYANSNPNKIKQLLSQDSSNFSHPQLKQVELFKAVQSSSYEDYLQTNIITQESANNYYSQTQEAMSPREMDMTKVEEKMGREYKGLSNDEKNEELVNLASEFENKKQNGTASKTDIMRLEVAYRLLGVTNLAEFKQKSEDKGSKTFEVPVSETKTPTKTREQRIMNAANRVTGWNKFMPSGSIESHVEAINKGGSDRGENKIRASGKFNKSNELTYNYGKDLESFTYERNREIKESQATIDTWKDALPGYEKRSQELQIKITELKQQKSATKNGLNPFGNKGKQEKRDSLQGEIDTLKSYLKSSNGNIEKANSVIKSKTLEIAKITKEIADYKKELSKKYTL
jgi:hypothetical protein